MTNPYQQYKEQSLNTLAPGELLIKLFDETIKQMRLACLAIENKDLGKANDSLSKAQTIISTLAASLDMRCPISKELRDMYVFFAKQLHEANMKKDKSVVFQTIPLVKELRDSFEQANKINRKSHAMQTVKPLRGVAI